MTITIMVYNINLNGRGRGRVTSIVFKGHEKCFTVALHIPQYDTQTLTDNLTSQ